jgi:predicted ribosomally synthesized peptide with nif11-like leader
MSIQDAVTFIARASENADLAESLSRLDDGDLVGRAGELGLSFTIDELRAVVSSPDLDPSTADAELSDEDLDRVSGGFTSLARRSAPSSGGSDPMAVVQWALRESYGESCASLRDFADKLKHFNDTKKSLRDR